MEEKVIFMDVFFGEMCFFFFLEVIIYVKGLYVYLMNISLVFIMC